MVADQHRRAACLALLGADEIEPGLSAQGRERAFHESPSAAYDLPMGKVLALPLDREAGILQVGGLISDQAVFKDMQPLGSLLDGHGVR